MATTARPFGTMNQTSPDVPQVYACAEDIMTAIDQDHTAITDPTPKPRPVRRPAITKSWVLRTIARTPPAIPNMKTPRPSISPIPSADEMWVGVIMVLLSPFGEWQSARMAAWVAGTARWPSATKETGCRYW